MTTYYGAKVGAIVNSLQSTPLVAAAYKGGQEYVLVRDTVELETAFAQDDLISLGKFHSDVVINPDTSTVWFDDLGTSITMDIGSAAAENALVAAQDVATAAGSCSLYKSVDIANYHKPLWQVLGLSSDPGGFIELFAKLEGGNPGTGTVAWQVCGRRLG